MHAATSLLGHVDREVVPTAQQLVGQAGAAMAALRDSLSALRDNVAAPDSAIQQTTRSTLEQLENAARSLRGLTDYLQHHPNHSSVVVQRFDSSLGARASIEAISTIRDASSQAPAVVCSHRASEEAGPGYEQLAEAHQRAVAAIAAQVAATIRGMQAGAATCHT